MRDDIPAPRNDRPLRALAFVKYGDQAASTRQRILQFAPFLEAAGIELTVQPLFSSATLREIYASGRRSPVGVVGAYADRMRQMGQVAGFDLCLVQRELFPYLPGWFEKRVYRSGVPIIYDFDDAIFHQYDQHRNLVVRRMLGGKLEGLLQRASLAIGGNAYLAEYAARFCTRTEIVPTVVDTDVLVPVKTPRTGTTTVGWIGSPSTWAYLRPLIPTLEAVASDRDIAVSIVGASVQDEAGSRVRHHAWSEATEVSMIQSMSIGVMPLPDEPWARGKCGYKLIQYMACGLPVVASPVGVNTEIVQHGVNGFLARSKQEWAEAISILADDPELRERMGKEGRRRVVSCYSLTHWGPKLALLARSVVPA